MANRTKSTPTEAARTGAGSHHVARRQSIGGVDVVVIVAMAAASVAVGVALHLQADLNTLLSGSMAAAMFVLLAFIHLQKLRLDRLGRLEVPAERLEPALPGAHTGDIALEIASSKLAAAAAAMRDAEPTGKRKSGVAPASRRQNRPAAAAAGRESEVSAQESADHGWGEPGAVDALVRQYAKELDRGASLQDRQDDGAVPMPHLAVPPVASAPGPELLRPLEGPHTEAIRRGAGGDVEIHLQPIVSFADRKARLYEEFPRLTGADGKVLGPSDYLAEAEDMGLALAIERSALVRCCAIQRKLSDRGRARAMIVRLSGAAIRDRAFLQRLIADINPDPLLTDLILFEIDQVEIEQGDGVERDNMELLGKAGFRFSLGSADTLALEVEELTMRRIAFVRVSPAVLNAEQNPAAVSDLRQGGIETILTSISREEDVRVARAFGLVLGQGPLFSEPKPLRSDVTATGTAAPPNRAGRTRAA